MSLDAEESQALIDELREEVAALRASRTTAEQVCGSTGSGNNGTACWGGGCCAPLNCYGSICAP